MDRMMEEVIEQEEVTAVRTNEEEAPFPGAWPADIKSVLDKYTPSVLKDELTEKRGGLQDQICYTFERGCCAIKDDLQQRPQHSP